MQYFKSKKLASLVITIAGAVLVSIGVPEPMVDNVLDVLKWAEGAYLTGQSAVDAVAIYKKGS